VVYVTHDQEEAMTLGGRIAVMRDGAIEQIAPPSEVYARPVSTFVARFIGSPAMNLVPAAAAGVTAPHGALVGIRPHDVRIDSGGQLRATVDLVEPRGPDALVHLKLDSLDGAAFLAVVGGPAPPAGTQVRIVLSPERLHFFDGVSGARLDAHEGLTRVAGER
jgi:ABC-type sugar transport system ATPase subunit